LASFCMTTMASLRSFALAGNILFCLYGLLAHICPVFLLHIVLLPVNLLKLWRLRSQRCGSRFAPSRSAKRDLCNRVQAGIGVEARSTQMWCTVQQLTIGPRVAAHVRSVTSVENVNAETRRKRLCLRRPPRMIPVICERGERGVLRESAFAKPVAIVHGS
jgi:hypothetical protein